MPNSAPSRSSAAGFCFAGEHLSPMQICSCQGARTVAGSPHRQQAKEVIQVSHQKSSVSKGPGVLRQLGAASGLIEGAGPLSGQGQLRKPRNREGSSAQGDPFLLERRNSPDTNYLPRLATRCGRTMQVGNVSSNSTGNAAIIRFFGGPALDARLALKQVAVNKGNLDALFAACVVVQCRCCWFCRFGARGRPRRGCACCSSRRSFRYPRRGRGRGPGFVRAPDRR